MTRGQRAFVASGLLLLGLVGGGALVFREGIRERWLIWRLERGSLEESYEAAMELGAMGSLRAIEALAARIDASPSSSWRSVPQGPAAAACSALFVIAMQRREESLPYLLVATSEDLSAMARDAMHQLADVARGERDTVELSGEDDPHAHDAWFRIQASPDDGDSPSPPDRGGE